MTRKLRAAFAAVAVMTSVSSGAAQTYISGIDVSRWQGTVDWADIRADGIEFAFVRATRGSAYKDPLFLANMRGAAEAGVLVGPYHFCRLDSDFVNSSAGAIADATVEANHFLSVIKPYYDAGKMLPPVADVEGFPPNIHPAYNSAWVQQFSDVIMASLGVRPLIYTNVFHANTLYLPEVASSHDLWLARWTHDPDVAPAGPNASTQFRPWLFWQWTDGSQGYRVDGVPAIGTPAAVDGDVFRGSRAELEALLIGGGPLGGVPGGRAVLADFDGADFDSTASDGIEGYFLNSPTFSGSTTGVIAATTTADRVTTHAHEGTGSQRIFADATTANGAWTVRHVSGIGQTAAIANPAGNLPLASTGSIGFWLNTTNANVTVQIYIDDAPGALETSTIKNVIADGQWHLYEWQFDDGGQWSGVVGGNGAIDSEFVTIDSVVFKGVGDTTIYMDTVAHNPNGSLQPLAGDFNADWLIDETDYALWESGFGSDKSGGDFLAWQRGYPTPTASSPTASAVPEPAAAALAALALGFVRRRRRNRV